MGICASCLGRNRHPSHNHRSENDRLLADDQHAQYGTTLEEEDADSEPDEQDVRREREALEQITARAADNMINVLHADHIEADHHLTPNLSFLSLRGLRAQAAAAHNNSNLTGADSTHEEERTDEEIEQAWLREAQVADADNDITLKGSYGRNLVIDLSRLRPNEQSSTRREI